MNQILKISAFIIIMHLSSIANAQFSFGSKFFNYGNGAINLDNITYITPTWEYLYHFQNDGSDTLTPYSEVPDSGTINGRIDDLYGDGSAFEDLDYYFIVNSSNIKFDDFTLTILSETVHFKIPSCSEFPASEDIRNFALRVAPFFLISPSSMEGCEQLRKKQNLLTQDEIQKIRIQLEDTANTYDKIVN